MSAGCQCQSSVMCVRFLCTINISHLRNALKHRDSQTESMLPGHETPAFHYTEKVTHEDYKRSGIFQFHSKINYRQHFYVDSVTDIVSGTVHVVGGTDIVPSIDVIPVVNRPNPPSPPPDPHPQEL